MEGTRANDFATWRALEGRVAALLSRRPAAAVSATVTAIAETPVAPDNRVEPAQ
jgi:hypothetical protein